MECFGNHYFTARAPRKRKNRWCSFCGDPIVAGDRCERWACRDGGEVLTVEGHLACIRVWDLEPSDERREWYGTYYYEDNDEGRERCRAALRAERAGEGKPEPRDCVLASAAERGEVREGSGKVSVPMFPGARGSRIEVCPACGGAGRVCRCHGEPPHDDGDATIPCPRCTGGADAG